MPIFSAMSLSVQPSLAQQEINSNFSGSVHVLISSFSIRDLRFAIPVPFLVSVRLIAKIRTLNCIATISIIYLPTCAR